MKQLRSIHTYFFIALFSLGAMVGILFAEELSFEELFKDVDFEQLAREIEEELEKMEKSPALPRSQDTFTSQPTMQQREQPQIKNQEPPLTGDLKTIFLAPYKQEDKNSSFPTKKQEAYDHFMDRFILAVRRIETIVLITNDLSAQTKEQFSALYKQAIDLVESETILVGSNEHYLKVFFSEKAERQKLRETILALIDQLETLLSKIEDSSKKNDETKELPDLNVYSNQAQTKKKDSSEKITRRRSTRKKAAHQKNKKIDQEIHYE